MIEIKKNCCWFLGLLFLLSVSGCNTVHGVGQDLQAGGQAISKAASK